jgi:hypothetical protein
MGASKEISNTKEMLIKYGEMYKTVHPIRATEPPFPICGHDVINEAIKYGIRTCSATQLLIDNSQFEYAAIVARPFLELALRMLWCRQENDGWQRIVGYLARETLEAAKSEESVVGVCPISNTVKGLLVKMANNANSNLPNLWQMLDITSKKQSSETVKKNIKDSYAIFLKGSLHQMSHANLCFMALEQKAHDKYRIGRAIRRSAIWIINASHDYIYMSPNEVEQFVNRWVDGFSIQNSS